MILFGGSVGCRPLF